MGLAEADVTCESAGGKMLQPPRCLARYYKDDLAWAIGRLLHDAAVTPAALLRSRWFEFITARSEARIGPSLGCI